MTEKEKHNEYMKKYYSTEKGKAAHLKWQNEHPEKARESYYKYLQTEKGKAAKREANRRYREKMKQKSA